MLYVLLRFMPFYTFPYPSIYIKKGGTKEGTKMASANKLTNAFIKTADVGKHLDGAVVAIGNAPTALFHLLELLDAGAPKPAVILGFPVGFVGAAESKAELANDPRGCEFVALRGRKGGSAMASAAVNALAAGLPEDKT